MVENRIGRVVFLKVTASAPAAGSTTATATDQSPFDGFITGIEIIVPSPSAVGKLQYAVMRNDEFIYPENGYAERPISGSDDADVLTLVREGDNLTLIVINNDTSTTYQVVAKLTIEGTGAATVSERLGIPDHYDVSTSYPEEYEEE